MTNVSWKIIQKIWTARRYNTQPPSDMEMSALQKKNHPLRSLTCKSWNWASVSRYTHPSVRKNWVTLRTRTEQPRKPPAPRQTTPWTYPDVWWCPAWSWWVWDEIREGRQDPPGESMLNTLCPRFHRLLSHLHSLWHQEIGIQRRRSYREGGSLCSRTFPPL